MNTVISKVEHLKEVKLEYYYTMTYIIMLLQRPWYLQFAILNCLGFPIVYYLPGI